MRWSRRGASTASSTLTGSSKSFAVILCRVRGQRAGAVRSAVLIAIRQHELGLADSGHLDGARQSLGTMASSPDLETMVAIAEALTATASGQTRTGSQAQTLAYARISTSQKAWAEALRTRLPADRTSAYLWLSLACGTYSSSLPDSDNREAVLGEANRQQSWRSRKRRRARVAARRRLQRILDSPAALSGSPLFPRALRPPRTAGARGAGRPARPRGRGSSFRFSL